VFSVEEPILEDHVNEKHGEICEILKILMSVKNFKLWKIKMEGLLDSIDL
jgi:hypothetical protein